MLRSVLQGNGDLPLTLSPSRLVLCVVELSAPLLIAVIVVVSLAGLVQTRALFAPRRIQPDLARLSPLALVRTMLSPQRAFAGIRVLAASALVAYLIAHRLGLHATELAHTTGHLTRVPAAVAAVAASVARDVVLAVLGIAIVDFLVARHAWLSRLRLTRQEARRERQESEGDPHLKAARERAHRQMLVSVSWHAIEDATVVIHSPPWSAYALRYRGSQDDAPVLVAKGQGELARRVLEAAHANAVPVIQDTAIAQALELLNEGDSIPTSLYDPVAMMLLEIASSSR